MKRSVFFGLWLLLTGGALLLAQEQAQTPYEQVVLDVLKSLKQATKTLATIQDQTTAEAARPALKTAAERFVKARSRAAKMKQPDLKERERLANRYKEVVKAAKRDFDSEYRRARGIPGAAKVLEELKPMREPPRKKKSETKSKKREP